MSIQELNDKISTYYGLLINEWFIPIKFLLWKIIDELNAELQKQLKEARDAEDY